MFVIIFGKISIVTLGLLVSLNCFSIVGGSLACWVIVPQYPFILGRSPCISFLLLSLAVFKQ